MNHCFFQCMENIVLSKLTSLKLSTIALKIELEATDFCNISGFIKNTTSQLLYSKLGKRRSHSGSISQHYNYLWPPDQRLPFPSPACFYAITRYHMVDSQLMSRPLFFHTSVKSFSSHFICNFFKEIRQFGKSVFQGLTRCVVSRRLLL